MIFQQNCNGWPALKPFNQQQSKHCHISALCMLSSLYCLLVLELDLAQCMPLGFTSTNCTANQGRFLPVKWHNIYSKLLCHVNNWLKCKFLSNFSWSLGIHSQLPFNIVGKKRKIVMTTFSTNIHLLSMNQD